MLVPGSPSEPAAPPLVPAVAGAPAVFLGGVVVVPVIGASPPGPQPAVAVLVDGAAPEPARGCAVEPAALDVPPPLPAARPALAGASLPPFETFPGCEPVLLEHAHASSAAAPDKVRAAAQRRRWNVTMTASDAGGAPWAKKAHPLLSVV